MAGQEYKKTSERDEENAQTPPADPGVAPAAAQTHAATEETDDLLDEIDGVLESNAEEFVRGFVQKGGQ